MRNKLFKIILLIIVCISSICAINTPSIAHAGENPCDTNICDSGCNVAQEVKNAAGCTSATKDKLPNLIQNILTAIISIAGIISVVFVVIGGINYITSAGDANKVKKARDTIIYALIGLAACALSFAIVNFVITKILPENPSNYSTPGDCSNAGFEWNPLTNECTETTNFKPFQT